MIYTTYEDQLEVYINKIKSQKNNEHNFLSYVISNSAYLDMFDEVMMMVRRIGWEDNFVYVMFDKESALYACNLGYPAIYYDDSSLTIIQSKVQVSKFHIVSLIINHEINAFFFEMDVWIKRDPYFLAKHYEEYSYDGNEKSGLYRDLMIGGEYLKPNSANIGIFYVYSNAKTIRLFQGLTEFLRQRPRTFDQDFFKCAILQPPLHLHGDMKKPGEIHGILKSNVINTLMIRCIMSSYLKIVRIM